MWVRADSVRRWDARGKGKSWRRHCDVERSLLSSLVGIVSEYAHTHTHTDFLPKYTTSHPPEPSRRLSAASPSNDIPCADHRRSQSLRSSPGSSIPPRMPRRGYSPETAPYITPDLRPGDRRIQRVPAPRAGDAGRRHRPPAVVILRSGVSRYELQYGSYNGSTAMYTRLPRAQPAGVASA